MVASRLVLQCVAIAVVLLQLASVNAVSLRLERGRASRSEHTHHAKENGLSCRWGNLTKLEGASGDALNPDNWKHRILELAPASEGPVVLAFKGEDDRNRYHDNLVGKNGNTNRPLSKFDLDMTKYEWRSCEEQERCKELAALSKWENHHKECAVFHRPEQRHMFCCSTDGELEKLENLATQATERANSANSAEDSTRSDAPAKTEEEESDAKTEEEEESDAKTEEEESDAKTDHGAETAEASSDEPKESSTTSTDAPKKVRKLPPGWERDLTCKWKDLTKLGEVRADMEKWNPEEHVPEKWKISRPLVLAPKGPVIYAFGTKQDKIRHVDNLNAVNGNTNRPVSKIDLDMTQYTLRGCKDVDMCKELIEKSKLHQHCVVFEKTEQSHMFCCATDRALNQLKDLAQQARDRPETGADEEAVEPEEAPQKDGATSTDAPIESGTTETASADKKAKATDSAKVKKPKTEAEKASKAAAKSQDVQSIAEGLGTVLEKIIKRWPFIENTIATEKADMDALRMYRSHKRRLDLEARKAEKEEQKKEKAKVKKEETASDAVPAPSG